MVKIVRSDFSNSTHAQIEKQTFEGGLNAKLPLSQIGEECEGELWLNFHWAARATFTSKSQRTMFIGSLYEAHAIRDLKSVGIKVFKVVDGEMIELTGEVGEKQEKIFGATGHETGKFDGRCIGVLEAPKTEHLLEIKTIKQEKFKVLEKQGLEKAEWNYYCQMQAYMKLTGLKRGLFMAVNKNNGEYYIERVRADKEFANDLQRKVVDVVTAEEPPQRGYAEDHWKCKWCSVREVCEQEKDPLETCRSCTYSDMENNGKWICTNKVISDDGNYSLSYDEQVKGCSHYEKGWGL